jgi:hypothetical protein
MLTDEIEKMLTEVRSDIELVEETVTSNKILGDVRITISTSVGIFTSMYPDKSPERLSSRTNKSQINIPLEFEYTPCEGDSFSHSIKLKNTELQEEKVITVKGFNRSIHNFGQLFTDLNDYFSNFMDNPRFYQYDSFDELFIFVSNEKLNTVYEDIDEIIEKISRIIDNVQTDFIRAHSTDEFKKAVQKDYPDFSNLEFHDDKNIEKRNITFEWLNRSWKFYIEN